MVRYLLPWVGLVAMGGVAALAILLAEPPPPEARAELQVIRGDVVERATAMGRVVPRQEIHVRSSVPGILRELKVRPGDRVVAGDPVATIEVVADPVRLHEAAGAERSAALRLMQARRERDRLQALSKSMDGMVAEAELDAAVDAVEIAELDLRTARRTVKLVREGAAGRGLASTRVTATVDGTVLEVPVAVGDFISETSAFRDGTVLAIVADMQELLFRGLLDEPHVGRLSQGAHASVHVGALKGLSFEGKLEYVAPRATIENLAAAPPSRSAEDVRRAAWMPGGSTRFEIHVRLERGEALEAMRAGYSATAEIELERRRGVLLVDESALRFKGNRISVFVRTADGGLAPRDIEVGLSDGLRTEVVSGLEEGELVAVVDEEAPLEL